MMELEDAVEVVATEMQDVNAPWPMESAEEGLESIRQCVGLFCDRVQEFSGAEIEIQATTWQEEHQGQERSVALQHVTSRLHKRAFTPCAGIVALAARLPLDLYPDRCDKKVGLLYFIKSSTECEVRRERRQPFKNNVDAASKIRRRYLQLERVIFDAHLPIQDHMVMRACEDLGVEALSALVQFG